MLLHDKVISRDGKKNCQWVICQWAQVHTKDVSILNGLVAVFESCTSQCKLFILNVAMFRKYNFLKKPTDSIPFEILTVPSDNPTYNISNPFDIRFGFVDVAYDVEYG